MKRILIILSLLSLLLPSDLWAQGCSVCTQTAAGLGASSAQGLNTGILYLAALPLIFLGTIGLIWWKKSKPHSTSND